MKTKESFKFKEKVEGYYKNEQRLIVSVSNKEKSSTFSDNEELIKN